MFFSTTRTGEKHKTLKTNNLPISNVRVVPKFCLEIVIFATTDLQIIYEKRKFQQPFRCAEMIV